MRRWAIATLGLVLAAILVSGADPWRIHRTHEDIRT